MSSITAANSVNTDIQPSRFLHAGVVGIYALSTMTLFVASAFPLEAKALLLCFLIRELVSLSFISQSNSELFLNIDGTCRLNGKTFDVQRVSFFSRHLIILDLTSQFEKHRLALAFDAFQEDTFRHLSRVCLVLKM
ncbi:protein YgfX [Grimontia kaedaensis]|uniref:protein YgfX n=1 Tax=Grimontia kaedaensis TaxID=2872157 RepID=UPI00207414A4|nr:protein YgfX [Grimontia kaedaensis]